MQIMLMLILISLAVAFTFLGAFIWANGAGQFDDMLTPAMRILPDDNGHNQDLPVKTEERHGREYAGGRSNRSH